MMRRNLDLLAVIALCFVQLALVLFDTEGIVRVANGFLFVAFLPGYALLSLVLRTTDNGLERLEQVILAFPCSLAIGATLGLLFNRFELSTHPEQHALWLSLLTVEIAVLAIALSWEDRWMETACNTGQFGIFSIAIVAAVALGGVGSGVETRQDDPYVSLWVLDEAGEMTNLPATVKRNEPFSVTLGVSYEGYGQGFFILKSPTGANTPLRLRPGETWEWTTKMTLSSPGRQQVVWTLSSYDGALPDRQVALWIDVE